MRDASPSARAKRVWKRLAEFYGVRFTEAYGTSPPRPWCDLVDAASDDAIQRALSSVRAKYVQFPPTLPEFEQLLRATEKPKQAQGPSLQLQLTRWVLIHRMLTANQTRWPWQWLYTGDTWARENFAIAGVIVPADGEHPGYRVMLADMQLEEAA